MQSMAVMLLEMAYEGKHLKDEKVDLVACIKKLICWLRAMSIHDPVADRAYRVVYRILRQCTPSLQKQANELLADEGKPPQQDRNSRDFHQSTKQPPSGLWQAQDFPEATPTALDPRLSQQPTANSFPVDSSGAYEEFASDQAMLPQMFGNPFVTSFDQGAPVVNMQNLWMAQRPTGQFNMDFFDMSIYQNPQQMQHVQHDPDLEYFPPQQYQPPSSQ